MKNTIIQVMIKSCKISEVSPALGSTTILSLWLINAPNPVHILIANSQVIPKPTLTASPQASIKQIHGSTSTTRERYYPEPPSATLQRYRSRVPRSPSKTPDAEILNHIQIYISAYAAFSSFIMLGFKAHINTVIYVRNLPNSYLDFPDPATLPIHQDRR